MMKKPAAVCIIIVSCLFLSCAGRASPFRDGYYSAIARDWDDHGWKEFITICVNNGVITTVEYNAVNLGGFVKSWDTDYMSVMKAHSGTYPLEYTRHYAGQLLQGQGEGGYEVLTGATDSWYTFGQLARAVLEYARSGDSSMAVVPLVPWDGAVHE